MSLSEREFYLTRGFVKFVLRKEALRSMYALSFLLNTPGMVEIFPVHAMKGTC